MRVHGRRWAYGWAGVGVVVLVAVAGGARLGGAFERTRYELDRLPRAAVRRADLVSMVTAGGVVESAKQTVIQCELEGLDLFGRGQAAALGGSSTILSLVPEGSMVHQGDVLCQLDASDYEEAFRQQQIVVDQARAEHRQAELDLEVARMAVSEFRDGVRLQTIQEYEGQIALAHSDWERAIDRMKWSGRMLKKGYVSRGQVANESIQERKAALALAQGRLAFEIYQRLSAPKILRDFESQVLAAESTFTYQTARLQLQLDRLANLQRQIDRCTIRAPHDGLVIYANDTRRQIVIEPGIAVRQKQNLFSLPDLSQMQISTLLHESVVDQVEDGMRARVRVEGMADRVLEGHVVSVAKLPTVNRFSQIPYFTAMVKLDSVPRGLRPGMSSEVEIATRKRDNVLAIPTEALTIENGREVCYIASLDGLERREVKVGQLTRELLEVTEGLEEGEEVILDPTHLDTGPAGVEGSLAEASKTGAAREIVGPLFAHAAKSVKDYGY